jgi:hypothetical protein
MFAPVWPPEDSGYTPGEAFNRSAALLGLASLICCAVMEVIE